MPKEKNRTHFLRLRYSSVHTKLLLLLLLLIHCMQHSYAGSEGSHPGGTLWKLPGGPAVQWKFWGFDWRFCGEWNEVRTREKTRILCQVSGHLATKPPCQLMKLPPRIELSFIILKSLISIRNKWKGLWSKFQTPNLLPMYFGVICWCWVNFLVTRWPYM